MGITYVEASVTGPKGATAPVSMLVDSGATYSLLPDKVWRAIGLEPKRSMSFRLADGTTMERKLSDCTIDVLAGSTPTPVILGEPDDDEALLGWVTLEELGLVLDPFRRELRPLVGRM